MNAIRLIRRLDSETLHLPELRAMIGQRVEIICLPAPSEHGRVDAEFWNPLTLDELAARQGIGPVGSETELRGTFTAEDFDGFDEALAEWRGRGKPNGEAM